MKHFFKLLFLIFFILQLSIASATPEARVSEMIKSISVTGSYSALLEYIHWDSAFSSMTLAERSKAGVGSPGELKQQLKTLMENPEVIFKGQWEARLKTMTPDQKQIMQGHYEQQLIQMRKTLASMKDKIKRTSYEILGSSINGAKAVVTVQGVVDGVTKIREVQLVNVNGEWYLPALNMQGGNPFGN